MKKILIFILIILFISGCSNKKDKLICEYQNKEKNNRVVINFIDDRSVNYEEEAIFTFQNNIESDKYYNRMKENESNAIYKLIDNTIIVNIKENIEDMSKEEIKTMYERYGFSCQQKNHVSD